MERLAPAPNAREILRLARTDRAAARARAAALSVEDQAELVCAAPLAQRADLINLLDSPEKVVPRIPEAELCFTARAMGLESAAWLLELATVEQVTACLDLDAWAGEKPDCRSLDAWIAALAAGSEESLFRAVQAIDPELVVLFLRARVDVYLEPKDDQGWQPPEGAQTLEGQFYFRARRDGDDLSEVRSVLQVLFEKDYWTYFRMMQGVVWELGAETEEWALRWRTGRLQDLGFPTWEEAMGLYRHLEAKELAALPETVHLHDVEAWHLPVWIPGLPSGADSDLLLFQTVAQLDEEERRAVFYALVSLANRVAVADRLPLGDAESTPRAIEKAAHFASEGLAYVADRRGLSAAEVLRSSALERLFTIGANLDPEAALPKRASESDSPDPDEPAHD